MHFWQHFCEEKEQREMLLNRSAGFVVELKTLFYFSFFILSFWIMGRLSESVNDFEMEKQCWE